MTLPGDAEIGTLREAWDARCHFCSGPSFPWLTDDATWAKVEPLLGQHQACFECFGAAWMLLGFNDGEPFHVAPDSLAARLQETREALRNIAHTDDAEHARALALAALSPGASDE